MLYSRKLDMGEKMADSSRFFARNVQGVVVSEAGHWLMEEKPADVTKLVSEFLRQER